MFVVVSPLLASHELTTDSEALANAIRALKAEKQAVLLAHYYQDPSIQDLADYVGDSLNLARQAARTQARMIVFAGVHFMAEVAKMLNPEKKVILPDLEAGCSLADNCPPEAFAEFVRAHPGHEVVVYINTSAAVKALADVVVTSSNAEHIIGQIPEERPILFAPDRNLGRYLQRRTGRQMVLWEGTCVVHEAFSVQRILELKAQYPEALLLAHPECEESVLALADFVGSTTAIARYASQSPARVFIVATEPGILHRMRQESPQKTFIPAPPRTESCSCQECPYMRRITLQKIYQSLLEEGPEITLPEALRQRALRPIERMLALSAGIP
ncbi:MAG: quinolinate synthase NadA [Bacteroidota bacterium]|nr:quinolinate synthase NadA [Rhodothermia bacterium]MCS7155963.1 quinolinate synthase NadA [Bacteroidota bacterium]MDW8138064.1 quinolinate synthase NadA [Bacteroidota bacterium]MDW8285748.1 quinolinate synthase NadA [Bacteroidota bacterium]